MPRSARVTRKVERLVTLAEGLARGEAAHTRACCRDLLDRDRVCDDVLSGASCLNNDGVPLQLCLTSGRDGSGLRVIADPGADLESRQARYDASAATLLRALTRYGAADLVPAARDTLDALLPQQADALVRYGNGLIWIAASPDAPGVAFYVEMAPFAPADGWAAVARWLDRILPDASAAHDAVSRLSRHGVVASAGLEGRSLADVRAKVYFRLREPMNLAALPIGLFASTAIADFLRLAMGPWGVDAEGLVLSTGFSVSTGALADVKVDLCGHCLEHTMDEWSSIAGALTARFSLAPMNLSDVASSPWAGIAFIGMGLTRGGDARLNVYVKHGDGRGAPAAAEIDDALTDACRYLVSQQLAGGEWTDFHLPVGASDQWVTAYAGHALALAGNRLARAEAAAAAGRGADWLSRDRPYAAGWGYNGRTGPDADSTAMAIALFDELGRAVAGDDRDFLRDHWRAGAGIATYDGPLAWGEAHWDVTPWGYLGMRPDDRDLRRDEFIAALGRNLGGDGFWRSYWWRHPYYSTFVTLDVLARLGIAAPSAPVERAAASSVVDNPFDLACYTGVLFLRDPSDPRLEACLRALLNWQRPDGAWMGSANLRVTENTCAAPWDSPQGAYYADHRGTITTATAIRVLTAIRTVSS